MCVVMRAIGRPYILICPTYTKGHCETQCNGKKWDTTACSTRMPDEVAGDKEPTSYLTNFTERKCIMVSIVLWHHDRAIPRLLGWNRSMVVSKHCRNTCQTFMSLICLHSPCNWSELKCNWVTLTWRYELQDSGKTCQLQSILAEQQVLAQVVRDCSCHENRARVIGFPVQTSCSQYLMFSSLSDRPKRLKFQANIYLSLSL